MKKARPHLGCWPGDNLRHGFLILLQRHDTLQALQQVRRCAHNQALCLVARVSFTYDKSQRSPSQSQNGLHKAETKVANASFETSADVASHSLWPLHNVSSCSSCAMHSSRLLRG